MIYSKHAKTRMQQRGITPLAIELLCCLGIVIKHDKEAETLVISKSIKKQFPSVAEVIKDTFVVLSLDGVVITVGHVYK